MVLLPLANTIDDHDEEIIEEENIIEEPVNKKNIQYLPPSMAS